jgi:hypothetical protein
MQTAVLKNALYVGRGHWGWVYGTKEAVARKKFGSTGTDSACLAGTYMGGQLFRTGKSVENLTCGGVFELWGWSEVYFYGGKMGVWVYWLRI